MRRLGARERTFASNRELCRKFNPPEEHEAQLQEKEAEAADRFKACGGQSKVVDDAVITVIFLYDRTCDQIWVKRPTNCSRSWRQF